jgi:oligoendopeptidase F
MNAVGIHEDVQTMLHEGGHAFHVYESAPLPYFQQMGAPMEFCEVASTAMEFMGGPYLTEFYDPATVSRVRTDFIEGALMFWAYMAVVDAFQHWVYANPDEAMNPANCDAKWQELERRFRPFYDWSGHEEAEATGWHRKLHIFQVPFYYVEYGLAQLGAVQVWKNAISDQAQAVANYRKALALGGIRPLPELFETAGARFAFDVHTLGEAVELMLSTVDTLSNGAH